MEVTYYAVRVELEEGVYTLRPSRTEEANTVFSFTGPNFSDLALGRYFNKYLPLTVEYSKEGQFVRADMKILPFLWGMEGISDVRLVTNGPRHVITLP